MPEVIEPNRLCNTQALEAHVNGPDDANRLYVYSGMAELDVRGAEPHPRWSQTVVSFTVGEALTGANDRVISTVAVASLAAVRDDGVASFAGWRVYAAAAEWDEEEKKTRINVLVGSRDTDGVLEQIAYQVNVLAHVE